MQSSYKTAFVVFNIVFAAGFTPILIRYAQGAGVPSLVIVFIRLWLVTLGLLPIVWLRYRKELFALTRRQIGLSVLAGFWSALNLLMLFFALEYTSVLITSVLRRTTPLWIILPEIMLLGAVFSRRIWWSLGITFIGAILIALGGNAVIDVGSQPLLGAGIATFGAICFGIYLLIGRQLSHSMPSLLYSWLVFFCASLFITLFVMVTQTPILGYSMTGYLWTLSVTFVAQVMGQVGILVGLQRFSATAMAIIVQVGVVVSAIIAVFAFNEIPSLWQIIGSVLIIVGVILATIEQNQRQVSATTPS
ncbi:MAG: DMT family transporter [Phototrophicaceae bacterium]